ncbi:MAG TPA: erythromycin esterase family protein [Chloroflexia bacterium]
MHHRLLALTSLICLMLSIPPSPAVLYATPARAIVTQQDSHTFPETGKTVKGRFLQYWQQNGGLAQQGYPISEEMQERSDTDGKTYTVQYFERAVFELHPENQMPYDVLLSLLGTFEYKRKYSDEDAPGQLASTENPLLFPETGQALGGKFRVYWETHGGLAQQGYPISNELREVSPLDGKTYTVQYFERAVFELHPENAGSEHEVLLSQLGKFQYDRRYKAAAPTATTPPLPQPSPASTVPHEVTQWLREHAIPLSTTTPGEDYADLLPLKQVVGDAHIVALGEASHGGREFFTMKHRILRFLVKEMGFTIFAIEDGWAEVESINNYIQGGPGTAEQAVRTFPVVFWRTREVIDMIEWMRAYNQGRGDAPAISFQGVDMQTPVKAMQIVLEYLQTVDPSAAERARSLYGCYNDFRNYVGLPPDVRTQCRAALRRVYDDLTANRESYEEASSPQAFARAQFGARIVLQNEELQSDETTRFILRDRYMAENAGSLLEQGGPGARMMVWAHNGHVGMVAGGDYHSMGAVLKERYKDAARIIGFDFYKGSFNSRPPTPPRFMQVFTIEASGEGSYANYFHSASIPLFILDLRDVRPGSITTDWLFAHRKVWWIGSIFNAADPATGAREVIITDTFDAVIFIDTITPTNLLPD